MKRLLCIVLTLGTLLVAGNAAAQELRAGIKSEPSAIDPHYHNLGPNNALSREIFDRLIMTDSKQQLLPGLAVSWKAINDLTWEFKLRKDEGGHFQAGQQN